VLALPARKGRVSLSKAVIHKVLGLQGGGLRVQSPTVICAGKSSKPPSEPPCRPKDTSALRRCTCGGMIVVPLLGVGPSFQVFKSQGGAKDDAHCSNLLLLALGPSPNKSLQRAAQP
jgi:hypothetical protein